MYDPKIVAFEIRSPFRDEPSSFFPEGYRRSLVTIWHVDPESDNTDDSCGWTFPKLTTAEREYCKDLIYNENDNLRHWFCDGHKPEDPEYPTLDGMAHQVMQIMRNFKRFQRPWYRHPKWHFWHWEFQIHDLQHLKRWLFTKCKVCGESFKWGETGIGSWNDEGPRWFRSEELTHMRCDSNHTPKEDAE
jgi:hypothetical protein